MSSVIRKYQRVVPDLEEVRRNKYKSIYIENAAIITKERFPDDLHICAHKHTYLIIFWLVNYLVLITYFKYENALKAFEADPRPVSEATYGIPPNVLDFIYKVIDKNIDPEDLLAMKNLGFAMDHEGRFWNWFDLHFFRSTENSDSKPLKVNEAGKFIWIFCSVDKELAQALVKTLPQYFTPRILRPKIGHRFPKPRFNLTPFSG